MFPPPVPELMPCLGSWERFLHDEALPPLLHVALAHSQFEAIHPFIDGNGRIGRLLITLLLVSREILPSPLLYLSAYFEATRQEYYARLQAVTEKGEWEEWLVYFLTGVVIQSEDALDRVRRIDELFTGWKKLLADGRSRLPESALELFIENPFWTIQKVAERLNVAFTTAQRRHRQAGVGGHCRSGRRSEAKTGSTAQESVPQRFGGTNTPPHITPHPQTHPTAT